MNRTFYIASSRDQLQLVQELARLLEGHGLTNTFAWWEHFDHRCSDACGIPDRQALAARELHAAGQCDLFIGVARMGKGSHVELGAALTGSPKQIVLVGVSPADLVFYESLGVERIGLAELDFSRLAGDEP